MAPQTPSLNEGQRASSVQGFAGHKVSVGAENSGRAGHPDSKLPWLCTQVDAWPPLTLSATQ